MRTLEPNLGNVAFARKVLIVEGPHDLLAYRTAFERYVRFGLRNIAVVAAWGKDSLLSLVKLCRRLAIPYFVVHDWDLPSEDVDLSDDLAYAQLDAVAKGQFTKNRRILTAAGADRVHANKPSLEGVLHIPKEEKSAARIFLALHGKPLAEIWSTYPGFLSAGILDFLEVDAQVLTRQPRAVAVAEQKGARAVDKRSPDD